MTTENVAVVGASEKTERVSNQACQSLTSHGHQVYAISLHGRDIQGATGCQSLADIPVAVDTVTMYVGAARQAEVIDQIVDLKPRRVIFNPGSESEQSEQRLTAAGIQVQHACTLVLLNTDQF